MRQRPTFWIGIALLAVAAVSVIALAVHLASGTSESDALAAAVAADVRDAEVASATHGTGDAATPQAQAQSPAATAGAAGVAVHTPRDVGGELDLDGVRGARVSLRARAGDDAPAATVARADGTPAATPRQHLDQAPAARSSGSGSSATTDAGSTRTAVAAAAATLPGIASSDVRSNVVARIRIPAAGIDANVVTGQLSQRTGDMLAPRGPWAVAWYPYSATPGQGGNAVFSGHVDYVRIGAAVFWNLRKLRPGDTISVQLTNGSWLTYRVDFNRSYGNNSGPWSELFHPVAGNDVITLYTCDGSFSRGDYNQRRVVRASRAG